MADGFIMHEQLFSSNGATEAEGGYGTFLILFTSIHTDVSGAPELFS